MAKPKSRWVVVRISKTGVAERVSPDGPTYATIGSARFAVKVLRSVSSGKFKPMRLENPREPRGVFISSVVPEHKGLMTAYVSTYELRAATGRHIRKATQVVINGYRIRFMEKMSVKEAVKQAVSHIRPSDNHLWEKVGG